MNETAWAVALTFSGTLNVIFAVALVKAYRTRYSPPF